MSAQRVLEAMEQEIDALGSGERSHEADTENFSGELAESAGDVDAIFFDEILADRRVIDALRNSRRRDVGEAMSGSESRLARAAWSCAVCR